MVSSGPPGHQASYHGQPNQISHTFVTSAYALRFEPIRHSSSRQKRATGPPNGLPGHQAGYRATKRATKRATGLPSGLPVGPPSGLPVGLPKSVIFIVSERNGLQKRYNLNGFKRATGQKPWPPRSTESKFRIRLHVCLRATVRT